MNIYKEGDTGRALCEACGEIVSTTYSLRDVPLSDGKGKAKGVLAIVCDACNAVCGIPQQSLARVQKAVQERESIESRVPIQIDDILNVVCLKLDASTEFRGTLIRYYAKRIAEGKVPVEDLPALLADSLVSGKSSSRVSVKGARIKGYFETIERAAHLKSHADVIKLIAVQAKRDVLDGGSQAVVAELQQHIQLQ